MKIVSVSVNLEKLKIVSVGKEAVHESPVALIAVHQRHTHVQYVADFFIGKIVVLVPALVLTYHHDALWTGGVTAVPKYVIGPPVPERNSLLCLDIWKAG